MTCYNDDDDDDDDDIKYHAKIQPYINNVSVYQSIIFRSLEILN